MISKNTLYFINIDGLEKAFIGTAFDPQTDNYYYLKIEPKKETETTRIFYYYGNLNENMNGKAKEITDKTEALISVNIIKKAIELNKIKLDAILNAERVLINITNPLTTAGNFYKEKIEMALIKYKPFIIGLAIIATLGIGAYFFFKFKKK